MSCSSKVDVRNSKDISDTQICCSSNHRRSELLITGEYEQLTELGSLQIFPLKSTDIFQDTAYTLSVY